MSNNQPSQIDYIIKLRGKGSDGANQEKEEEEVSRSRRERSWRPGGGGPNIFARADSWEKPKEA
ncbi:hypothetical protein SORBI_3006G034275 [Sorghum bicolor]|uniref:Uncharacterized protein n=1 Tax=Sorghum bicolor TaxID=4558 RepID=A0A1Z5RBY9_SORBI|nr:hypothetical protein SORBI_3006G034275 [Sorghum bicolor]